MLHTVEHYGCGDDVSLSFVKLDDRGHVDLEDLRRQLAGREERCLVTLMHANNEIGNLLDIDAVG